MSERYKVVWTSDLPDEHRSIYDDPGRDRSALFDTVTNEVVDVDYGEPEDNSFRRDWRVLVSGEGKVTLSDDYFLKLTSLNADYTSLNPLTVNPVMGARELSFYRLSFMLLNYAIGYVRYPGRIVRTLRTFVHPVHPISVQSGREGDACSRTFDTACGS